MVKASDPLLLRFSIWKAGYSTMVKANDELSRGISPRSASSGAEYDLRPLDASLQAEKVKALKDALLIALVSRQERSGLGSPSGEAVL